MAKTTVTRGNDSNTSIPVLRLAPARPPVDISNSFSALAEPEVVAKSIDTAEDRPYVCHEHMSPYVSKQTHHMEDGSHVRTHAGSSFVPAPCAMSSSDIYIPPWAIEREERVIQP